MRRTRRKVAGDFWNEDVDNIRSAIKVANGSITEIKEILEEHKNAQFIAPIAIHLASIASALATISTSTADLDQIAQSHKQDRINGNNDN